MGDILTFPTPDPAQPPHTGTDGLPLVAGAYVHDPATRRRGEVIRHSDRLVVRDDVTGEHHIDLDAFTHVRFGGTCSCSVVAPRYWTTYGSAVEPGSMLEPDADCAEHFPQP